MILPWKEKNKTPALNNSYLLLHLKKKKKKQKTKMETNPALTDSLEMSYQLSKEKSGLTNSYVMSNISMQTF